VFDFRKDHNMPGWYWHRWAYWLQHGGWFVIYWKRPLATLRWWWRFAVAIPRSRGWRWD